MRPLFPFPISGSLLLLFSALCAPLASAQAPRHNVIIFVADGLRRGSVDAANMPTFLRVRSVGVDFRNSHAVFPTFTTANASVIATGHGLGDTGDYSNTLFAGTWLARPDVPSTPTAAPVSGSIAPFLEDDEVLANMNSLFHGNYLGERTLLSIARQKGFNVASIGKQGPTAIQQIEAVQWQDPNAPTMYLGGGGAIIIDDSTGQSSGVPLPLDLRDAILKADLGLDSPLRTNGYGTSSQGNNAFQGDAQTPGTLEANRVQEQWFADVTTKVLLPQFAAEAKPFILLFWSRDPDGTQHNQGDSLQNLAPGINGETSARSLRNADHCLKQLLDWLDANPAIKANTDVLLTSDHGFATISRREIAGDGTATGEASAALTYEPPGNGKPEPAGTLPLGFLAVDLAIRAHVRIFDPAVRSATGSSLYAEVVWDGTPSHYPSGGSAFLGDSVKKLDGADARLIVAANGGSDLIYVPSGSAAIVKETIATLAGLDYVGGIFVNDMFCAKPTDCPGALPLSAIGLVGSSAVPRPAIVVNYKVFYQKPGDLQSAAQIADTSLQEGQGMHGGFGRDQTFNNMAAMGPDFKKAFVDDYPMGNIDIVPTLARILGITMPSTGTLKGRVVDEALQNAPEAHAPAKTAQPQVLISAPTSDGKVTRLEYQVKDGVHYYDRACFVTRQPSKDCS